MAQETGQNTPDIASQLSDKEEYWLDHSMGFTFKQIFGYFKTLWLNYRLQNYSRSKINYDHDFKRYHDRN
jgi:hypothetical protein